MSVLVETDPKSGFCGGVIRAISQAEKYLDHGSRLYSLGAIVHNEAELKRLEAKGLVTIGKDALATITSPENETLLIRAHGEPPETYSKAEALGLKVIDCTCPVVLRLQKSIREAYERLQPAGGQIVLFGKIGHPEVLGLLGQVGGDAVVVENMTMLEEALAGGTIRLDKPLEIFSQTTKSPSGYAGICAALTERSQSTVTSHNTICSQVASRYAELSAFASSHDIILFVSGASSSNGKVLSDLCRSYNPRTYPISSPSEIVPEWLHDGDKVGVCGATSTPRWLLEEVASKISALFQESAS